MTFNFAPWAVDGARTSAALARLATYASSGGKSGIVQPTDLRVLPLEVPGVGLRVLSGGATVMNHYLQNTDQAYVVSNPGTHVVQASSMPPSAPTLRHFLVAVVVGDPEFDQTGHPFMPSTPLPPELAADYEYVRVVMIPCSAGTTRFEELGATYPGYALARVEIPPNTTTITSAMITDLRQLAQPRTERKVLMNTLAGGEALTGDPYVLEIWPAWQPTVEVPSWATRMSITVTLANVVAFGSTIGQLRIVAGNYLMGTFTGYDIDAPFDGERRTILMGAAGPIAALAGTTIGLKIEGTRDIGTGYLTTHDGVSVQLLWDIQFDEAPA